MWCSQGKRPVRAEACTGVLSARMDDGGRRARPPALSGADSVCGAKMGRQLSLERCLVVIYDRPVRGPIFSRPGNA